MSFLFVVGKFGCHCCLLQGSLGVIPVCCKEGQAKPLDLIFFNMQSWIFSLDLYRIIILCTHKMSHLNEAYKYQEMFILVIPYHVIFS